MKFKVGDVVVLIKLDAWDKDFKRKLGDNFTLEFGTKNSIGPCWKVAKQNLIVYENQIIHKDGVTELERLIYNLPAAE